MGNPEIFRHPGPVSDEYHPVPVSVNILYGSVSGYPDLEVIPAQVWIICIEIPDDMFICAGYHTVSDIA